MQNNVTILTITKHMYSVYVCICVCVRGRERVKESYSEPGFLFKYPDCKSTMSFCQLFFFQFDISRANLAKFIEKPYLAENKTINQLCLEVKMVARNEITCNCYCRCRHTKEY